jgi:hypothetical protein
MELTIIVDGRYLCLARDKDLRIFAEIWKELDQTKRMQPNATFSDHPFRSWSSLKIRSEKMK